MRKRLLEMCCEIGSNNNKMNDNTKKNAVNFKKQANKTMMMEQMKKGIKMSVNYATRKQLHNNINVFTNNNIFSLL